jgi:microsomal dipeptidase-like Zn-dependent dipeptidase
MNITRSIAIIILTTCALLSARGTKEAVMSSFSYLAGRCTDYLVRAAFVIGAVTASHAACAQVVTRPIAKPPVVTPTRPIVTQPIQLATTMPLQGFVDLHAHLMSHVAFGGKFIYGGVDAGSLVPIDRNGCLYINAANESDALNQENMAHGGWGTDNGCGDPFREAVIHAFQEGLHANDPADTTYHTSGPPNFATWPKWDDLTRQRMWVDWIRRSYNGGLRVMVALATNSKLFGDLTRGPGDLPDDDMAAADMQIREIKAFAARHPDFVAIAYSSGDLYNIVASNKLAIVLGVEVDQIGNLRGTASAAQLMGEVDRLYAEGVRYIFPIHISDNPIGGTAVSIDEFALVTRYENGNWWTMSCMAMPISPGVGYQFQGRPGLPNSLNAWLNAAAQQVLITAKLGPATALDWQTEPGPTPCPPGSGNVNSRGLSDPGKEAIVQMMRHGMLIDIDHMSNNSVRAALALAQTRGGGYPLNSGHNSLRGFFGGILSERNFDAATYAAIGQLHGMAGVGSAKLDAYQWMQLYNAVVAAMGGPTKVAAGFGTDFNGLEFAMPPRGSFQVNVYVNPHEAELQACHAGCRDDCGTTPAGKPNGPCITRCERQCDIQYPTKLVCQSLCGVSPPNVPPSTDGTHTWNYNTDGVAHYGMLPDFLTDISALPGGPPMIQNLMTGADYFFHTWQIAEAKSAAVH